MEKNVGETDKVIRLIAGIALVAFGLIGIGATGTGLFLSLIGVVLIVTGAINFCPLFKALGHSSVETNT